MHTHATLPIPTKQKLSKNNKRLLIYGLNQVDTDHTAQHRCTMRKVKQFTITGSCCSRVTVVWKKKYRTNEDESREERKKKSHGIKQSVPRARQRSDCVAEWVILLHLLPQQGGCVCVDLRGCVGEKERASKRKRCPEEWGQVTFTQHVTAPNILLNWLIEFTRLTQYLIVPSELRGLEVNQIFKRILSFLVANAISLFI